MILKSLNEAIWRELVPEKTWNLKLLQAAERTRISGPLYEDDRDPAQVGIVVYELDYLGNNLSEF